jgi:SAM-dependent methyltransferase
MSAQEPGARPPFVIRKLRGLARAATSRAFRHELMGRLGLVKGGFQPGTTTFENRYPETFAFVRAELGEACAGRILSFGCSSGEEVFSLRDYFPKAAIEGIDVNPGSIALCRRRLAARPDPRLSFRLANSTAEVPDGAYDAIFSMAVFRDGRLGKPGVRRCDHLLRFDDFARMIADFERCLRPGGLLAVRHSNFFVADTPSADRFEIALSMKSAVVSPIFGPDNRLIEGAENREAVFRKKGS